jgi:plastocyanin
VLGSFAFSVSSYSFVAGQNVTGTIPVPGGNETGGNVTTDNATTGGNATTGNATTGNATTGNVTGGNVTAPPTDNMTGGNVTTGGNETTTAAGEVNTFFGRGQLAGMVEDEILGGDWKIDVIDGQAQRVQINITMSTPDGGDFHTHLIDNFTSGGEANETGAAGANVTEGNVTGGNVTAPPTDNMTGGNVTTAPTTDNATTGGNATTGNATGGNATTGNATTGNETTLTLPQVITGGNETGATDNATAPAGNATTIGNVTGGNETGGNVTAPTTNATALGNETGGGNVTAPAGNVTGDNETAAAGTITLAEDGTFEISGTVNMYSDDSEDPEFENVPITIESTGRILIIEIDSEASGGHFGEEAIYGFVTGLIGDVDGNKQSVLPPLEGAPTAPAPTDNVTAPTDNVTAPTDNVTAPTDNVTAPTDNVTAPTDNVTAPGGNATTGNATTGNATPAAPTTGGQSGGGGGTQVSITSGSSTKAEDAYDPNPVEASVGDTVTWTNDDSQPHTVTSGSNGQPDGTFDSSPNLNPLMAPGQTFEHTFEEPGEFPYYCAVHPNMVGTVNVS